MFNSTTTEQCEQMHVLFLSCSIVNYVKLQKAIGQILFLSFCTYLGTVRVPPTKRPPVVVTTEFKKKKNIFSLGEERCFRLRRMTHRWSLRALSSPAPA